MLLRSDPLELMILLPLFIISIGLHEAAHAYTAHYLGDDTPEREGRLTINPLAHLDLFGTIFLLVAGFGWGKSVNVDPRRLRHPQRDMSLIAAAGPGANLLLGLLSVLGLMLTYRGSLSFLADALLLSAFLNFFLMFLNLVPIPPLDGAKVLRAFLPDGLGRKFDEFTPYGSLVFLALIFLPGVSTVFLGTLQSLTSGTIGALSSTMGGL
ncbi:MAG TPA: site-2 protease family protein [Candidatus Obscuribacterales bacterium]